MHLKCHENLFGYLITLCDAESCVRQILDWIVSGQIPKYLVCANPHSIIEAESDPVFKEAIKNADLVIPDGIGIVIASKILGGNIRKRISGSDIFYGVNRALNNGQKYRSFFLGSTDKNLKDIEHKMTRMYPNIEIVGTYSPPFRSDFSLAENRLMCEIINRCRPDILWVGMGAPKQEKWIYQNKDHLEVKFICGVGALFDFFTGNVKRSPEFFLNNGLEWLIRLLREPRRLWRRNFISTPRFLLRILQTMRMELWLSINKRNR